MPCDELLKSASNQWYLLRLVPYLTQQGMSNGVVAALIDVTEIKESELTALAVNQAALRGAGHATHQPVRDERSRRGHSGESVLLSAHRINPAPD